MPSVASPLTIVRHGLDLLIALYLVNLVALLITGGYEIEVLGIEMSSTRLWPALNPLLILALLRFLLSVGWRNSALVVGSVLVSLLLAEGTVRIWNPAIAQADLQQVHRASPRFDWELLPDARGTGGLGEDLAINSHGMRDQELDLKKATAKRIAIVGDSFTFGMGVNLQDTYVKQLETALLAKGHDVQVLNFGVIGYQLWQYLEVLEHRVLGFDPDLVVVGFFVDDIVGSAEPVERNPAGKNRFEISTRSRVKASYLINTLRNLAKIWDIRARQRREPLVKSIETRKQVIGPDGADEATYRHQAGEISADLKVEFLTAMAGLVEIARAAEVPLLMIYIPDATQLFEPARQRINALFSKTAGDLGVEFLDLTPHLEAVEDAQQLYLFPVDGHTSAQGNRVIAQALAAHPMIGKAVGSRN